MNQNEVMVKPPKCPKYSDFYIFYPKLYKEMQTRKSKWKWVTSISVQNKGPPNQTCTWKIIN